MNLAADYRLPQNKRIKMIPLSFLDTLADAASAAIMPHFRTLSHVENKIAEGFDPVTVADRAGEAAMRALIEKHYPDHGILGEEFDNKTVDAESVWVLDPIDGTRSFIVGVPVWGILIGHKTNNKADIGMMCQPFTDERFFGDGQTAWHQRGRDNGTRRRIKTRACQSLAQATLFTTSPNLFSIDEIKAYKGVEDQVRLARYGIDCYAYCMLACGHADLVIESGLNAYDIAALIPIIEGAGGSITTWQGDNAVFGGSIIASGDPALHDIALAALNKT